MVLARLDTNVMCNRRIGPAKSVRITEYLGAKANLMADFCRTRKSYRFEERWAEMLAQIKSINLEMQFFGAI